MSLIKEIRRFYSDEFVFYSQHHQNNTNWCIHAVTIPIEWISWLTVLCFLNLEWFTSFFVAGYYFMIQTRMSTFSALSQFLFAWIARYLFTNLNIITLICSIVAAQVISWFIQIFVGHRLFEGNNPAMATKMSLNSVVLSVLLCWDY